MTYRTDLPPRPSRIEKLPLDERGYPIPWFVATLDDGTRDFRIMDPAKRVLAHRCELCWVCGEPRGRYLSFVIGPMCTVNRVSAEPPCHHECAIYSVRACPFLSKPHMERRDAGMPDVPTHEIPGMIHRNPGAIAVWTTKSYRIESDIFRIGEPLQIEWYSAGRKATREEVLRSVETGIPILMEMAQNEGEDAVMELRKMLKAAEAYYPK